MMDCKLVKKKTNEEIRKKKIYLSKRKKKKITFRFLSTGNVVKSGVNSVKGGPISIERYCRPCETIGR